MSARSWARHWARGPEAIARRFNELDAAGVLPLLEELGLPRLPPAVRPSVENRVLCCEAGGGERLVLKLYRPGRWSADALREELAFLAELRAAGVPVVEPAAMPGGGVPGTWEGIHFVLFVHLPLDGGARAPLDEEAVRDLGRLAARIHAVGARRPAAHRMTFDPPGMAENLAFVESAGLVPPDLLLEYRSLAHELLDRSAPLCRGLPTLRLHGDLGVHNMLFSRGRLVVIDFDDLMMGPAAFDLCRLDVGVTATFGVPDQDAAARDRCRRLAIEGYREIAPLPGDRPWSCMEALRALRMLWNDAWKCARLHDRRFCETRRVIFGRPFWIERIGTLRAHVGRLRLIER